MSVFANLRQCLRFFLFSITVMSLQYFFKFIAMETISAITKTIHVIIIIVKNMMKLEQLTNPIICQINMLDSVDIFREKVVI